MMETDLICSVVSTGLDLMNIQGQDSVLDTSRYFRGKKCIKFNLGVGETALSAPNHPNQKSNSQATPHHSLFSFFILHFYFSHVNPPLLRKMSKGAQLLICWYQVIIEEKHHPLTQTSNWTWITFSQVLT